MTGGICTKRSTVASDVTTNVSRPSRAQSLIWTAQKLVPRSPAYNMAWRFDLPGPIDEEAFRTAFESIVAHCDALRLTFEEVDGEARQRDSGAPAGILDLVGFKNADEADRWIDDQLGRVFDLSRETFNSSLLRVGGDRWTWFLNQHHLATDAISGEVIHREMAKVYAALLAGEAPERAPMPSFLAHAERESAVGDPDSQAFWQGRLSRWAALPRLYGRRGAGCARDRAP